MFDGWQRFIRKQIAAEISRLSRYCDRAIQFEAPEHDRGEMLDLIDCPVKERLDGELPDRSRETDATLVLLNGNLNHTHDIQALLTRIKGRLNRRSRVVAVIYNPYIRSVYSLATAVGLRRGPVPRSFVTRTDLANLAKLSGFEVTRYRPVGYVPFRLGGAGELTNRAIQAIPGLNRSAFVEVVTLRPVVPETETPSLSVIVPARNEQGNIRNAVERLLPYREKIGLELVFVEGHSTDDTWGEIQRVAQEYAGELAIKTFQQQGKGKADAVRLGFSRATGELVTILDADLTMPPELLGQFYDAYVRGLGDFINGSRLVYPMEGEAMRFLNRLGNVFFAKALSGVLGVRIGDSLCGTKLVRRSDYERFVAWRHDFGDFDPFGDYELIFPASILGLGIVDVPVRYRARTYGNTNISRFRHGFQLLRMTAVGFLRVSVGSPPSS